MFRNLHVITHNLWTFIRVVLFACLRILPLLLWICGVVFLIYYTTAIAAKATWLGYFALLFLYLLFYVPVIRFLRFLRLHSKHVDYSLERLHSREMRHSRPQLRIRYVLPQVSLPPSLQRLCQILEASVLGRFGPADDLASPQGDSEVPRDKVDVSVFSKPRLRVQHVEQIQTFFHLQEDLLKAARLASLNEPRSNRVASCTLDVVIPRGAEVELFLESSSLIVDNAFRKLVWQGEPTSVIFDVMHPDQAAEGKASATLNVGLNGVAIGRICFELPVYRPPTARPEKHRASRNAAEPFEGLVAAENAEENGATVLIEGVAYKYKNAFISYSRKDLKEVSLFAQGLAENDIELFFDVTSIEPGQEWASEIEINIPKADTFYLMWSRECRSIGMGSYRMSYRCAAL